MKSRNIGEIFKNAAGTVFLLAAAFFVCSTFVSMRAVFADPIAPQQVVTSGAQSPRASTQQNSARSNTRTTPRGNATTPGATNNTAVSRTVSGRASAGTSAASRAQGTSNTATTSRGVVARTTASNTGNSRGNTTNRAVVNRATTGANTARVSLTGTAIRGSKSSASNTYTYLSNKLYTGNYSNIIDSSTGLISAEAYSNCMESYYTCMDEICTARNASQRRCACAGRVKSFANAEAALETANEELIKVSGELALLIATKGKDVSAAFQLTDAEKVMNCVSWQDARKSGTATADEMKRWCENHGFYNNTECSVTKSPSYCDMTGNNFGFDIKNIDGSSSDILASLQSWADAKEATLTITSSDNNNLLNSFLNLTDIVGGMTGNLVASDTIVDSLAETWGYELFEYAHNNVCNRVLDSCFNGIFEACGAPPSTGKKCGNGASSCPYNYNSVISVTNSGEYKLDFVTSNVGYTASNSATCFGYTSSSGDPYHSLRGPVADSRRSILQKYALDANADCDAYGEQLKTTAQNIAYQKVAAQQALQQKRLEFIREAEETTLADARTAVTNFNQCLNEIYDCYETINSSYGASNNGTWTNARIKTYCHTMSNAPSCYEEMVCNPSGAQFIAVINETDSSNCNPSLEVSTTSIKACRNVVTLNEILNGTGASAADVEKADWAATNVSSIALREKCLQTTFIPDIRSWKGN